MLFGVTINKLIKNENSWWIISIRLPITLRSAGVNPVVRAVLSFFLRPVLSSSSWNENHETIPLLYQQWYFDFTFPISGLSHFDKVTPHCQLKYPAPFTEAHPNAIIHMKYVAQTEENISVYCSEIKPGLRCQLLSVPSRAEKNEISPPGTANPPLVCTAAAIQQNKIIPVAS